MNKTHKNKNNRHYNLTRKKKVCSANGESSIFKTTIKTLVKLNNMKITEWFDVKNRNGMIFFLLANCEKFIVTDPNSPCVNGKCFCSFTGREPLCLMRCCSVGFSLTLERELKKLLRKWSTSWFWLPIIFSIKSQLQGISHVWRKHMRTCMFLYYSKCQ